MNRRLLFVINDPAFFLSHRLPVAAAAQACGYEVHVATAKGDAVAEILGHGFVHHAIPLSRSGRNPLADLRLLVAIFRLFRLLHPAIVHLVTIKPVLYGGIAARMAGVPAVVAAISGMGFLFTASGSGAAILRFFARKMYRAALASDNIRVIVQNPDDLEGLAGPGLVARDKVVMVRGSGVDLSVYRYTPESDGVPVVAFVARMLRDKGVVEFVEAAQLILGKGIQARFILVGLPDPENPASISQAEFDAWKQNGSIELLGFRGDVATVLAMSNLVVLPSYREGLPKVLMEAAACGRAIVTTDVPGCRYAVEPGRTGLLVPARNAAALAQAIERLLNDAPTRSAMGKAGRELAEREFSIERVVAEHLNIYSDLMHKT